MFSKWKLPKSEQKKAENLAVARMPERDSAGHEGYAGALTDKKTQTEHEYIRWRQTEGITAAKAIGLHFTNALKLPENFWAFCEEYKAGNLTLQSAARKSS